MHFGKPSLHNLKHNISAAFERSRSTLKVATKVASPLAAVLTDKRTAEAVKGAVDRASDSFQDVVHPRFRSGR